LKGAVKLIFQPYEEGGCGALLMIEDGALENPRVDAFIGLHTGSLFSYFKPGEIGYRPGIINSNSDMLRITFTGKGGHGSAPHRTIDPVVMAAHAIVQLQSITSRSVDPFDAAVISVTRVKAGFNHNVIPDSCELEGTIRSFSTEVRDLVHKRIHAVCKGVAEGFGGSLDIDLPAAATAIINDEELTGKLKETAESVVGKNMVRHIPQPGTWGEDMGQYMKHAPGVYFFHSSIFGDPEKDFPHHHPKFTVNEDTLWSGSAIFARFALSWQQ
jgi:amidohydrolase